MFVFLKSIFLGLITCFINRFVTISLQSRARLSKRKEELEDILHELEMRVEEEEDLNNKMMEEKKMLSQSIKDLEDQ